MRSLLLTAALLTLSTPAWADVKLSDIHAFETSEGLKNGAVLLTIENTSPENDKLISVSTPAADKAEIHEMKETGGIMKMREVGAVEIPAGQKLVLDGETHIMLLGLKEPLKAGVARPITLKFLKGGEIVTSFKVKTRKPVAASASDNHSGHTGH